MITLVIFLVYVLILLMEMENGQLIVNKTLQLIATCVASINSGIQIIIIAINNFPHTVWVVYFVGENFANFAF